MGEAGLEIEVGGIETSLWLGGGCGLQGYMRGGMSGGLLEYIFDVPNPFNIFQSADLGISGP